MEEQTFGKLGYLISKSNGIEGRDIVTNNYWLFIFYKAQFWRFQKVRSNWIKTRNWIKKYK